MCQSEIHIGASENVMDQWTYERSLCSCGRFQGLPRLSASELSNARRLFLQALLQAVAPDSDYFESITDCLNGLEVWSLDFSHLYQLIRVIDDECTVCVSGESRMLVKAEISARNSALRCAESLKQFVESSVTCSLASENKQITSFW